MSRHTKRLLPLLLLVIVSQAHAANLARTAAYSVVVSGFVYPGQIIPGTNTPATCTGFMDAPPWQGPADTLTDGNRAGQAVTSWFWSNMDKRITVVFDLRCTAKLSAIRAFPATGGSFDKVTAQVAGSFEGLAQAPEMTLEANDGGFRWNEQPGWNGQPGGNEQAGWNGRPARENVEGRFVRLVCASRAPQMSLAEVEIEGEAVGPVVPEAPKPGLIIAPPRDLSTLARAPQPPAGAANLAPQAKVLSLGSRHYDDKTGAWVDDTLATATGGVGGRALIDGDPATAVSSYCDWYAAKTITVELDLGRPCRIDRLVAWSAGHASVARSYINSVTTWLKASPEAAWMPVGETRNQVLPGEIPAAQYPIAWQPGDTASGAPVARCLRLQFNAVAQSADMMQVGEIEVWGCAAEGTVAAQPWRQKKAVPAIAAVALGKPAAAFDWILKDRIRCLYGYSGQWQNADLLRRTQDAGFNAFIFHTSGREGHSEDGWRQICAQWAKVQQGRGLRVLVSWPFGSDERYGNTQFGAYQPGGTQRWTHTPCPLSADYWNRVVGDRAVIAAKAGLTGLVVDMEMYGGDMTRYPGPCYADDCWRRFVDEYLEGVRADDVPLAARPAWIAANGLTADYARWQELEVMRILRGIEQRVHAVKPDFILGNLLDPESLPGLARGLGTPTMPVLVFSELEYSGNLAGTPGRIAQLRRLGYPALYVPGFWPQPVTPTQLAKLIPEGARQSAGFWVWSSLAYDDKTTGEYAHNKAFAAQDCWSATKAGNDALNRGLAEGKGGGEATASTRRVPEATVPRVSQAPQTDADWAAAAVLAPFVDHATGAPAKAATKALALWDGKRLHLRVLCDEPTPEKMLAPKGERDSPDLWMQDSIEVFWMRNGERYAHLIVNSAGTVFDALADGLKPEDTGWNADVQTAARKTDAGWALDISVPLDADGLGALAPGSTIYFEIARDRPGGGETTAWAPVQGMFKAAPGLWGVLKLK